MTVTMTIPVSTASRSSVTTRALVVAGTVAGTGPRPVPNRPAALPTPGSATCPLCAGSGHTFVWPCPCRRDMVTTTRITLAYAIEVNTDGRWLPPHEATFITNHADQRTIDALVGDLALLILATADDDSRYRISAAAPAVLAPTLFAYRIITPQDSAAELFLSVQALVGGGRDRHRGVYVQ